MGMKMLVARPPRHGDVVDDLVALWVDNENVVALLVADVDQPGAFRRSWGDGERRPKDQAERHDQSEHFTTTYCFRASLRLIKGIGQDKGTIPMAKDAGVTALRVPTWSREESSV